MQTLQTTTKRARAAELARRVLDADLAGASPMTVVAIAPPESEAEGDEVGIIVMRRRLPGEPGHPIAADLSRAWLAPEVREGCVYSREFLTSPVWAGTVYRAYRAAQADVLVIDFGPAGEAAARAVCALVPDEEEPIRVVPYVDRGQTPTVGPLQPGQSAEVLQHVAAGETGGLRLQVEQSDVAWAIDTACERVLTEALLSRSEFTSIVDGWALLRQGLDRLWGSALAELNCRDGSQRELANEEMTRIAALAVRFLAKFSEPGDVVRNRPEAWGTCVACGRRVFPPADAPSPESAEQQCGGCGILWCALCREEFRDMAPGVAPEAVHSLA